MKKRIYKINNKNLVTGNPNEVTENEILVKENNDGTIELSHRNNGTLETLGSGGNGGPEMPKEALSVFSMLQDSDSSCVSTEKYSIPFNCILTDTTEKKMQLKLNEIERNLTEDEQQIIENFNNQYGIDIKLLYNKENTICGQAYNVVELNKKQSVALGLNTFVTALVQQNYGFYFLTQLLLEEYSEIINSYTLKALQIKDNICYMSDIYYNNTGSQGGTYEGRNDYLMGIMANISVNFDNEFSPELENILQNKFGLSLKKILLLGEYFKHQFVYPISPLDNNNNNYVFNLFNSFLLMDIQFTEYPLITEYPLNYESIFYAKIREDSPKKLAQFYNTGELDAETRLDAFVLP